MKEYDLVVIGSGAGLVIVENALAQGLHVALVDKGPLGGTCLNLGCIPSKMVLYPADRIAEIGDSKKLGVEAKIVRTDFLSIMERMRRTVQRGEEHIRKGIRHSHGLSFHEGEGHFVDDYTLEVSGERIKGRKIVIAAGARPNVPEIKGINETDFLTNESVLRLTDKPKSIIIIGGGYIAAEYAHFFSSMGVRVTLLQRNLRLVPEEEPEISALLQKEMMGRMQVLTGTEATEVLKRRGSVKVRATQQTAKGVLEFDAELLMAATGRASNADILKVQNSGIETDKRNFIKVNEYFETSRPNIWAFGDIIGKKMFRHVANREAAVVWHNLTHNGKAKVNYDFAPHAVFSYPEIASVGMTEQAARKKFGPGKLLVGKAKYSDVARGEAMMEGEAFAKAIVRKRDGQILGFHIIGPHASILIQEVINAMASGGGVSSIVRGMHIHPALPEVIISTLGRLHEIA